jgi:hypothetical protein
MGKRVELLRRWCAIGRRTDNVSGYGLENGKNFKADNMEEGGIN